MLIDSDQNGETDRELRRRDDTWQVAAPSSKTLIDPKRFKDSELSERLSELVTALPKGLIEKRKSPRLNKLKAAK